MASCKKSENKSTDSAAIQGTYKLMYLAAHTNSTVTATDGEKTVTTADYTTMNNQGTLVFDKANVTYSGLTYSIETQVHFYSYQDNDLVDSSSAPFQTTLPPTSATTAYSLFGADSILFPQGSVTSGGGSPGLTLASGGRYSFSGNVLTIVQQVSRDSTFVDSGETVTINESGVTSTVLQKQ